ncbi:MAG: hypothetical protein LBB45_02350 [Methanobrevibacter sp.]|nr:hypothetical protein [Candidatus Methanovirga basalitermitum]
MSLFNIDESVNKNSVMSINDLSLSEEIAKDDKMCIYTDNYNFLDIDQNVLKNLNATKLPCVYIPYESLSSQKSVKKLKGILHHNNIAQKIIYIKMYTDDFAFGELFVPCFINQHIKNEKIISITYSKHTVRIKNKNFILEIPLLTTTNAAKYLMVPEFYFPRKKYPTFYYIQAGLVYLCTYFSLRDVAHQIKKQFIAPCFSYSTVRRSAIEIKLFLKEFDIPEECIKPKNKTESSLKETYNRVLNKITQKLIVKISITDRKYNPINQPLSISKKYYKERFYYMYLNYYKKRFNIIVVSDNKFCSV